MCAPPPLHFAPAYAPYPKTAIELGGGKFLEGPDVCFQGLYHGLESSTGSGPSGAKILRGRSPRTKIPPVPQPPPPPPRPIHPLPQWTPNAATTLQPPPPCPPQATSIHRSRSHNVALRMACTTAS